MSLLPIRNAIISVYHKQGLDQLARELNRWNVTLYATGGTASFLEKEMKLPVKKIEHLTQFPEMMDGRVKTLHPKVFGGILARREEASDLASANEHGIVLFDLVVGNLYPFSEHLGESPEAQTSFIDIGGPSMLRAAAKNSISVTVVSDPADYAALFKEMEAHQGGTSLPFRRTMAARTFSRTSHYDSLIASEWAKSEAPFPERLSLGPAMPLRYGENPHQKAAWLGAPTWKCLQGKELSYNNLLDSEAAVALTRDFSAPAVAIIKHNSPCGVASSKTLPQAKLFERAFQSDSKSAFGGIVSFNEEVNEETARAMSAIFLEVVIAPRFSSAALTLLAEKKNLRLIEWAQPQAGSFEIRAAMGGWLVQSPDHATWPDSIKIVSNSQLSSEQLDDLKFAWIVCKHVRSNAIVLAKNGVTLGIGGGQVSRVDAVQIALQKALGQPNYQDAVLASDAFFPFRDNIDALKGKGITAIVQPGGSQRDTEVITACNELGIGMAFTSERHFRH